MLSRKCAPRCIDINRVFYLLSRVSVQSKKAPSRTALPFIPAHDSARGLVTSMIALSTFVFMLAVMCVLFRRLEPGCDTNHFINRTFQAGFVLSIVIGLGVGDALLGRYALSTDSRRSTGASMNSATHVPLMAPAVNDIQP